MINRLATRLMKAESGLAFIFVLVWSGLSLPYGLPLFLPLVFCYSCTFLLISMHSGRFGLRITPGLLVFAVCGFFYLLGILWSSGRIYQINRPDLANMLSGLLLWPIVVQLNATSYKRFISLYHRLAAFVLLVVAAVSLYKFYALLQGVQLGFVISVIKEGDSYPGGTSLIRDYNMFTLSMYAGLLANIFCFEQSRRLAQKIFHLSAAFVMLASIVFSGSRRGWVVFALLALLLAYLASRSWMSAVLRGRLLRVQRKTLYVWIVLALLVLAAGFVARPLLSGDEIQNTRPLDKLTDRLSTIIDGPEAASESFSGRSDRWAFAWELVGEYNLFQVLLGRGFDYLETYRQFAVPTLEESHPHNQIVSALHYSGLVGATFVALLVLLAAITAFRHKRLFGPYFLLLYVVAHLFLFISGNSIFSNKVLILLYLIVFGISKTVPGASQDARPLDPPDLPRERSLRDRMIHHEDYSVHQDTVE